MALFGSGKKETAFDALSQSKQAQQELVALRAQVARLRYAVQGMWELLKAKCGVTDQQLMELMKRGEETGRRAARVAETCPQCARALQAGSEVCIYCGAKVERRELFF